MHKTTMPFVSIVVPVFNEETLISKSLFSLLKQDYPKDLFEIIVVDNGSSDRSAEIIQSFPVQYVFEEKKGAGAARNAGARRSIGELIAFIDADCIAYPNWISNLVSSLDKSSYGAVGGDCRIFSKKSLIDNYLAHRGYYSQTEFFSPDYSFFPWLMTGNLMVCREAFFKVGGFDETLLRGEDIDFSWRLIKNGFQLRHVSCFEVLHLRSSNLLNFYLKLFRDGKASILISHRYEALITYKMGGRNFTYSEKLFAFLKKIKSHTHQILMKNDSVNVFFKIIYFLLALTGWLTFNAGKGAYYIRYGFFKKTIQVPVLSNLPLAQENSKEHINAIPV